MILSWTRSWRRPGLWSLVAALLLVALSWLAPATPAAAQANSKAETKVEAKAKTKYVEVSLVSERAAIAPGQTFMVAFVQRIQPGWHTYWINPGDSGEPTRITWTLPKGFSAGGIIWPVPERIPVGPLANYGFPGEVRLLTPVTVPKNAKPGTEARIQAAATWLVCKDVCVPEEAAVELTIPVAAESAPDEGARSLIAAALDAAPKPAPWSATFSQADATLSVQSSELAKAAAAGSLRNIYFFANDTGWVEPAGDQSAQSGAAGVALALPLVVDGAAPDGEIQGVLAYETRGQFSWERHAVTLTAQPGGVAAGTTGAPVEPRLEGVMNLPSGGFLLALGLAFMGGLILNLMPCVFPVLSIKALSLARAAHGDTGEMRVHGIAFLFGVLVTFAALGGALLALKAGGAAVGWGFQLQSPVIVGGLALLFFILALNLFGAFSVAGEFQGFGGALADKGGAIGAFFTGAVAVIVATPCTAPFMGAALGYGLTAPAWQSMGIFLALGFGLAAPFTLLAFAPFLVRVLPKPGVWMQRFKEFLAFPMLGAAIWLVWVLAQQADADGVLAILAAMAGVSLLVWAASTIDGLMRWLFGGLGIGLVVASFFHLNAASQPAPAADAAIEQGVVTAQPWSKEAIAMARAQGKTVFVNFTAAWCVTCKLNETVALNMPAVRDALSSPSVVYLKGDWTKRDAAIAQELAAHQRAGVPLYLVYRPGETTPQTLPQILSEDVVLKALDGGP